jgi:hypothetical protein
VLEHGEGIRVTDDRGRTDIDRLSGVFTSNLGHGNPEIADALAMQPRQLAFGAPTLGTNTRAAELVEQLLTLVRLRSTTVKLLSWGLRGQRGRDQNRSPVPQADWPCHEIQSTVALPWLARRHRPRLAASGWAGVSTVSGRRLGLG